MGYMIFVTSEPRSYRGIWYKNKLSVDEIQTSFRQFSGVQAAPLGYCWSCCWLCGCGCVWVCVHVHVCVCVCVGGGW